MSMIAYTTVILSLVIYESYDLLHRKRILNFAAFSIIINIISNIFLANKFPGAHVSINYSWGSEYLTTNVGQTWFYAVSMLFSGFFLVKVLNSKKWSEKVTYISISIMSLAFNITVSPRATAIILTLVMFAMIVITWWVTNRPKSFVLLLLPLIIMFAILSKPILTYTLENLVDERLAERIFDLQQYFSGLDNRDSSFYERITLLNKSLEAFTDSASSFLIGVGYHVGDEANIAGIGQHSSYIDVFAKYGVIGGTIQYFLIIDSIIILWRIHRKSSIKAYINIITFIFISYGFLNNSVNPGIFLVFYLFAVNLSSERRYYLQT